MYLQVEEWLTLFILMHLFGTLKFYYTFQLYHNIYYFKL